MHRIDAAYCYRHVAHSVVCHCVFVCMLNAPMSLAETDKPIEMLFGRQAHSGPKNHVLD